MDNVAFLHMRCHKGYSTKLYKPYSQLHNSLHSQGYGSMMNSLEKADLTAPQIGTDKQRAFALKSHTNCAGGVISQPLWTSFPYFFYLPLKGCCSKGDYPFRYVNQDGRLCIWELLPSCFAIWLIALSFPQATRDIKIHIVALIYVQMILYSIIILSHFSDLLTSISM